MADVKKLAEELTKLTVLEVNELKNVLKDEYGIEPAAAAVAVAGPAAARAGFGDQGAKGRVGQHVDPGTRGRLPGAHVEAAGARCRVEAAAGLGGGGVGEGRARRHHILAVALAVGFFAPDASAQCRHRPVRSDEVKFDQLLRDKNFTDVEVIEREMVQALVDGRSTSPPTRRCVSGD